jgi:signal transduction histidine kinase
VSQRLLRDVRAVVSQTRESTHFDLSRAARGMAAEQGGLAVHVDVKGADDLGDTPAAYALLRSMQEIITNANKHSGARNLWIRLETKANGVELHASDDGRGSSNVVWGNGLTGMREPLELLGGRLEVNATPQRGFDLHARVPRTNP